MKNELRIENFISRLDIGSGNQRTEKILELLSNRAITTGPCRVIVLYEDIKPIILTEEWLLKFGFVKSEHGFFNIEIPKTYKAKISFSTTMNCQMCQSGLGFNVNIKHVHQLQNLYFSLTGTELTYKNKS